MSTLDPKKLLGLGTDREAVEEELEEDVERRDRPRPTKVTLADLAFRPILSKPSRRPPVADSGKITTTMFTPADSLARGALAMVDQMIARAAAQEVRVDRRAEPGAGRAEPDAVASALAHAARSGPGQALPPELAAMMSARLGADLSSLRLHDDAAASLAAAAIGAEAFTIGDHIYFARGHYQPGTEAGLRLLAHEVAHAVQQRTAGRGGFLEASMPSDAHEVDADQFAERMVAELHGRRTEDGILRDPADAVEHARSRGVQVDLPFKSEMESHFGVSFDYVKAFTGRASEEACKFVSAAAFAVHDLIVLADPSPKREQLLHELTHIMQMGKQPAPPRFAPGSILVGERESEAEHEAAAPVHGARPRVSAPANVIHREDPAKPTLLPDSSTPEERIKIFANDAGKWAPEKHAGNADTWPYGAKLSDGTWLMYERSSPESFQLREYQKRLWEHPANDFNKKYKTFEDFVAKTKDDMTKVWANVGVRGDKGLRISRVGDASASEYVFTLGPHDYHDVVEDRQGKKVKTENDQFPAYLEYVRLIKPKGPLAGFDENPTKDAKASKYREDMRKALADYYAPLPDGWSKFHEDIVTDLRIFCAPHTRIQGDTFAKIVEQTKFKSGVKVTATEPGFQPIDVDGKIKFKRRGDGYVSTLSAPKKAIVAECKAVTGKPTPEHLEQIKSYAAIVDTDNPIMGYFADPQNIGTKQNVRQITFDHVAYIFSSKDVAKLWRSEIYSAFGLDPDVVQTPVKFSIVPNPGDGIEYLVKLNPTFRFYTNSNKATSHTFTAPLNRHSGVQIKQAQIESEAPGSPKIKSGSVTMDIDMAGAAQSKGVKKPIAASTDADGGGTVENKFTGFKNKLDDVLGAVETDAKLTDDGVEASIKVKPGAAKIPGFTLDEASLTARLVGTNLTIAGKVGLTHKNGKISGEIGVVWEGSGWVFSGKLTVKEGLIEGLQAFEATILYNTSTGEIIIGAPRAKYEKKLKAVTITGTAQNLSFDVKKGTFGGRARIEADLGAFGKAGATAEFEDNKLKKAELSYDSPELSYPKGSTTPVFKGTVGGTLTYNDGKFSGAIRGTADFKAPFLDKLGQPEGLGLAVDAHINEHGAYSGTIRATKPIAFGKHIKIPSLSATLEEDGSAKGAFSLQVVNVKFIDDLTIACTVDKDGLHIKAVSVSKTFGDKTKDRVSGEIKLAYTEEKGLEIGGSMSVKIREGMVATGTFTYSAKDQKVKASLEMEEIKLVELKEEKKLFEVKRKIPVFNFYGVGIYIDIGFDLKFAFDFDLKMKPKIGIEDLSLETFDYKELKAEIGLLGALTAALIGTPHVGIGLFVLSPDLLSGGGGLKVPITGKMEVKPSGTFTLTYKPDGGIDGGAKVGLQLTFGITGEVKPYAEFSVLKDTYNPKWEGEALTKFDILKPKDLLSIVLDFGGDMSKPKKPEIPATPPETAKPEADRTFANKPNENEKDTPAEAKKDGRGGTEMPPDEGKTSPGFNIDTLMGALKSFGPVQSMEKIVKAAAEVWEKIKGFVGHIVKIVKNWFSSAVDAIEGVIKGIAEKGFVGYIGSVVEKKMGGTVYKIVKPLFDKFGAIEDKIGQLLDTQLPGSAAEAFPWIWKTFQKLLGIGWDGIGALVSAIREIAANIGSAITDLLNLAVDNGAIGVRRHHYWFFKHFLAATEYKIDILGSGIYFREEGMLNNLFSAVGIALFDVLEERGVKVTNWTRNEKVGDTYRDRWVGGNRAG